VAVLPSYYKEGGYPRALLEPMAFGKPVVTTDIPDCRGPVEHGKNGYLVPVRDSMALAGAIELLIGDRMKNKKFGRYSRKKIENEFDDRKVVEKILAELNLIREC
jgi:glycosyltransferase involved in cell wall biosynthesis